MTFINSKYPRSIINSLKFLSGILIALPITLPIALPGPLLASNPTNQPASEEASPSAEESSQPAATDNAALLKSVKAVLTRNYPGIDTAALIAQIQQRLQWSEKDESLIEAEGILHFDRGETYLALPCFIRLSKPSPMTMGLMAECLLKKGQQYEAAAWFLKSAEAYGKNDALAIPMYRQYLAIKPNQEKIEMQFAASLERQKQYAEALEIFAKYENKVAKDPAWALRIGNMLISQARENKAIALYQLSLEANPNSKILWTKKAQTQEIVNQRIGAAQSWISLWKLDFKDSTSLNRAIAHLEASGPEADSLLGNTLELAVEKYPNSAALSYKLAVIYLKANQREMAFSHLEKALKISPNNPTYLSRISEAITTDDQIKTYFGPLKAQGEKPGASARLILQVARGFSLSGDKGRACKAWSQARSLSPDILDGRRDAFLDLAGCLDPASQNLAQSLGEKILSTSSDREALQAMSQVTLRNKAFPLAANITSKLISAFPEEATGALTAAKTILAANDINSAKTLLTTLVLQAPIPEAAFLLGKIYATQKDFKNAAEQLAMASATFVDAGKLRAECLVELKDFQGAASEYESHYTRTGDRESLRAQVRLYHDLGNSSKEKQALELLNGKSGAGENEKLALALLQISQEDTAKALTLLTELFRPRVVLPKDSLWSKAALFLGSKMLEKGKCEKGIKVISMGISAAPEFASRGMEGNRDLFLKLSACEDPASLALAEKLGDKLASGENDREVLKAQIHVDLRTKSFAKAAAVSIKLIAAFPEEASAGFITAKAILNAKPGNNPANNIDIKGLLNIIVTQMPSPEASLLLGKILYAQKDYENAEEQFALASSVYPEALKIRADCLVELKNFQAAASEYENHFARTGDKESLRSQARLSKQAGNTQQERLALEAMDSKALVGDDEKLRLGLLQANQGDTSKALATFSALFKTRNTIPNDTLWSQAALILGNRMAREGKCDRAIKLLTMGIKSAPSSIANKGEVWMQIGDCQVEKSQWKEAYASYGQGVSADPYSRELARGRLQAAKKLNNKAELAIAYQAIYQVDPDDEDANAFLGSIRQTEKDYKQAAMHFRKLADLRPTDSKIWENLGNALAMIPDLSAASIPLQTAIDLGAESDEVYINRARAFRLEGSSDMAASILEFLLSRNAECYLALLWTAKFAEEDGESEKAMEMFKKVAKLSVPRSSWPELANQNTVEAKVSESP